MKRYNFDAPTEVIHTLRKKYPSHPYYATDIPRGEHGEYLKQVEVLASAVGYLLAQWTDSSITNNHTNPLWLTKVNKSSLEMLTHVVVKYNFSDGALGTVKRMNRAIDDINLIVIELCPIVRQLIKSKKAVTSHMTSLGYVPVVRFEEVSKDT